MKTIAEYYCPSCVSRVGGKYAKDGHRIRVVTKRCPCDPKPEPKRVQEPEFSRDELLILRRMHVLGAGKFSARVVRMFESL